METQISDNTLIGFGGKKWHQHGIERIYLRRDAIINLLNLKTFSITLLQAMNKSKTYFDSRKREFFSDSSQIRILFRQHGIDCKPW